MILDTDYITKDGKPIIRIFKKENGEFKIELDRNFQPYIYALLESDDAIEEVKKITAKRGNKTVRVLKAEKVQKKFLGRPIEVWKLIFEHPQDVPAIREKIREHPKVIDIFEYDIPFAKRYLIDKGLIPMEGDEELKLLAFDIETFYHEGEQFGEGEIIMISYADENEAKVITWKKIDLPYVEVVSSEREMIKRFVQIIREKDPDVLITYNGDNFDLPYLIKRAQKLGLRLFISRDKENPEPKIQRMGDRFAVEIKGRIHFDLFPVVRRTINLPTYTLEAVYEAVLGKKKTKLEAAEITAIWESEEGMKELAKYSMEDAKATYELGREFFPMEAELARLIGQSVWDVSRSSTGNLVEWFLLRIAYQRNELAPNKPSDEEYQRRLRTTYLGGYVKEPERGLWENIVYLDFRCHPADTKVVVKGKGIVNISEVREGDYVLGINGWHKVLKVWEYDYDGELVNVNGLKCTPNHKLPVVTQKKRQTVIRDSYAKSMLTNKVKGRIIATHLFESIGEIEKRKSEFSEEFILKSELAGIILAEGHLLRKDIRYFDSSRRRHRVSHQYRVAITVNEDEKELIDRINYIFEKLFGCKPSIKRKKNSKALTLQCAKKSVYLEIENIMREIENLDAASVLRGFFEGDGTINTVRRTVVANQGTRNKKKIELVSKLLNKLGIRHSTYTYTDEKNGKRYTRYIIEIPWRGELVKFAILVGFISTRKKELLKQIIEQKEMYQIENSGFYRLNEIHATKEYYKGKVYDLTLDGAPYYFANGILTHNSLYPSIIITHNVSPDTLEREGCKNYDVAPIVGYKFCKDFKGFISSILEELIETRTKIKKEMKATIDPIKRKMLDYRQKAVKLLANSHYGYMGYPKARWYSKECAESVTAWGRTYIEMTIKEIEEKFGFKVLYADTDGLYATIPDADAETIKKKAKEFLKYINSKLPGLLELEYEGFYLRGFFVTKKRYAVIDEEGKITTRGLEVVRRDWSEIAKETQAKVLEAILKDGSVEKAVEIVKKVVEDLAKYKVPLEKLVIHEQITKSLDEYKATGPHVAVARRLKAKGIKVRPGMIISYIILKGDKKISDRAILLSEYDPKKHKYDPDYYIEHQVLPAVLRILEAFGYRKEDLRYQKTKQLGLGAWLNVKK
ncbi:DNA polymerase domain-containing protein [Thermococcus barophilus]|uniref:DNA polymerase n=1 Tax=Thermococcus barophilus (strain DSM 11836 / MP) TaxID=391623 RepID=F0LJ76_THEBM|nr:DNA polymerase domain-containing protein [Thermococcus barophilus]ADT84598.1 archaeal DNA polymerase I [Thermococcus barophilus MP]